jgi:hypothetical protein
MQKERRTDEDLRREDALAVYRCRKMLEIQWDPANSGFVYSAENRELR